MKSEFRISDSVARMSPSATMAVSRRAKALKAEGRRILDLSAGEPDFPTPLRIRQAAERAMKDNPLGYTMVDGLPGLREAVCQKFKRENNLEFALDETIVTPGGKAAIFNALVATLNSGDEVVIPTPCWVSYPEIVKFCGGLPVLMDTNLADGFVLTPEALDAAITDRTRWLILNSPGNPTGAVYTAEQLRALGDVLRRHPNIWVLSDDIYEHLVYDGEFSTLAQQCPDLQSRILTVNGVSKAYAMTGWRIGYAGGPRDLIAAMAKVASQATSNACTVSQFAAIEALNGEPIERAEFLTAYQKRRDLIKTEIGKIDSIRGFHPEGAFYYFLDISEAMQTKGFPDDISFCAAMLEDKGIAVVPGAGFHAPGFIRLSYAAADDVIREALDRLSDFIRT